MTTSCPRPRKGGRIEWVSGVQFGNQYWDAVDPVAIPILKVKSQRVVAIGTSLPTDWRPKRPKRTSTLSELSRKIPEVRILARPVQSRVATVTLDMAEQYPNKSFWVSHVAVPRKHLGLEECIELSAHVLVAGRRAGSVKCTKCLQVCVNKHPRFWLPTARTRWQAKNTPFHPAAAGFT